MTHSWYVLMEEHTAESKRIETHTVLELHQWRLTCSRHVEGDRQEAEQMAKDLAFHYIPSRMQRPSRPEDRPGRAVFQSSDGAYLVTLDDGRHEGEHRLRITVAELIHTEERVVGPRESVGKQIRRLFS
ncbi:hypothetical protein ACIOWI_36970 [Streptomyces sp. NPDC087659]|uniref:hypothetical protein n=1 Tax=Streptomyces sp. NPDC087659 TaxID=3365801 RepID=UPI00382007C2